MASDKVLNVGDASTDSESIHSTTEGTQCIYDKVDRLLHHPEEVDDTPESVDSSEAIECKDSENEFKNISARSVRCWSYAILAGVLAFSLADAFFDQVHVKIFSLIVGLIATGHILSFDWSKAMEKAICLCHNL